MSLTPPIPAMTLPHGGNTTPHHESDDTVMLHKIHITKAGKSAYIDVDDSVIPEEVYAKIIAEGLKVCLNAKMTKITGMKDLEGEALAKLQADALAIAKKNLTSLLDATFKFSGTKAKSAEPREVINEATRLAREFVRDELKAQGITISHVPAKDITAAAKALVDAEDVYGFKAKAKEALAKRAEAPAPHIDLAALGIRPDPDKVAKAEAAKAKNTERLKTLSAKQAGQTKKVAGKATKSKPTASAADVLAGLHGSTSPGANVTH